MDCVHFAKQEHNANPVLVANDDCTDDLDEDEIIAEEMLNEADDTASNQMSQMKEQEFVEKSEKTRNPSLQVL